LAEPVEMRPPRFCQGIGPGLGDAPLTTAWCGLTAPNVKKDITQDLDRGVQG